MTLLPDVPYPVALHSVSSLRERIKDAIDSLQGEIPVTCRVDTCKGLIRLERRSSPSRGLHTFEAWCVTCNRAYAKVAVQE